ncbi:MAG: hypothetical protein ACTSQ5_09305, partial [Promethearchaeota archaeon]
MNNYKWNFLAIWLMIKDLHRKKRLRYDLKQFRINMLNPSIKSIIILFNHIPRREIKMNKNKILTIKINVYDMVSENSGF